MKRILKRVSAFFVVLALLASLVLSNSDSFVVKADAAAVLGKIITYVVDNSGDEIVVTTDPEAALLILSISVMCGMSFSDTDSLTSYINGFWTWSAKNNLAIGTLENMVHYTALSVGTVAMMQVAFDSALVQAIKGYILSLKMGGTIEVNGTYTTFSVPQNTSSPYTPQYVSFTKTLQPNSTYQFSMVPSFDNYQSYSSVDSLTYIVDGVNEMAASYSLNQDGWQAASTFVVNGAICVISTTSNTITSSWGSSVNTQSMVFPGQITFKWASSITSAAYNLAINADIKSSTIYGNASGANSDASSQYPSVSADGAIDLTMPANSVSAIPANTVVGQTATSVGTAVGAVSGTIADTTDAGTTTGSTTSTPDWAAAGTDSIDWSPLENLDLYDKFPFSLPWDLANISTSLVAVPEAPDYKFNIPMSGLHLPNFAFEVNFANYEVPVLVIRWGLLLLFTGGLAFAAYKLIKH
jgi:hypothetical protein